MIKNQDDKTKVYSEELPKALMRLGDELKPLSRIF
jgi:hypothetical protein